MGTEVKALLSGRVLQQEQIEGGEHFIELNVDVPMAVFVYVQKLDEDLQYVFVCGHLDDVPDEDGDAEPFVGKATWDGGHARLNGNLEDPLELGSGDCLKIFRSLVLTPELQQGRYYEGVQWEDAAIDGRKECQYRRRLVTPVRVGAIKLA